MSQDSPATAAGTEARTVADFPATGTNGEVIRYAGNGKTYQWRRGQWQETDGTPDTWAPVNRREMRDDVDRFRNERMPIPRDNGDALRLLTLAMEYYEHAAEVATRTSIAFAELDAETDELRDRCARAIMHERDPLEDQNSPEFFRFTGGRYSKSQTGAEKLVDLAPAMVGHLEDRRKLAARKLEAEKEMGVARRRHATAVTYANAFIFHADTVITGTVAEVITTRPDVTAGDTDRGSHAEG